MNTFAIKIVFKALKFYFIYFNTKKLFFKLNIIFNLKPNFNFTLSFYIFKQKTIQLYNYFIIAQSVYLKFKKKKKTEK